MARAVLIWRATCLCSLAESLVRRRGTIRPVSAQGEGVISGEEETQGSEWVWWWTRWWAKHEHDGRGSSAPAGTPWPCSRCSRRHAQALHSLGQTATGKQCVSRHPTLAPACDEGGEEGRVPEVCSCKHDLGRDGRRLAGDAASKLRGGRLVRIQVLWCL